VGSPGATYTPLSLHGSPSSGSFKGEGNAPSEAGHYLYSVYTAVVYEEQSIAIARSVPTTAVPVSLAMDRGVGCLFAPARGCADDGQSGGG
jgi:hypothetical protein